MCYLCNDEEYDQDDAIYEAANPRLSMKWAVQHNGKLRDLQTGREENGKMNLLEEVADFLTKNQRRAGILRVEASFQETPGVFPGQVYQRIATDVTDFTGDAASLEALRRNRDGDLFHVRSVAGVAAISTRGFLESLDRLADPEQYLVVHGA